MYEKSVPHAGQQNSKIVGYYRYGRLEVGPGYVRQDNRTNHSYVTLNEEQEQRWRAWLKSHGGKEEELMFGGKKQGGGGSNFVSLTGLFMSKSGNGMVGSVTPDTFNTIQALMEDAYEKGVGLVFFVGKEKNPEAKSKARLYVAIDRPKEEFQTRKQPRYSRGFGAAKVAPDAQTTPAPAKEFGKAAPGVENPPADDLDGFLESFDK